MRKSHIVVTLDAAKANRLKMIFTRGERVARARLMQLGIDPSAADMATAPIALQKTLRRNDLDHQRAALKRLTPALRGLPSAPLRTETRTSQTYESVAARNAQPRHENPSLSPRRLWLPNHDPQTAPTNTAACVTARLPCACTTVTKESSAYLAASPAPIKRCKISGRNEREPPALILPNIVKRKRFRQCPNTPHAIDLLPATAEKLSGGDNVRAAHTTSRNPDLFKRPEPSHAAMNGRRGNFEPTSGLDVAKLDHQIDASLPRNIHKSP